MKKEYSEPYHVLIKRYPAGVWNLAHWWLGVRSRGEHWLWRMGRGE